MKLRSLALLFLALPACADSSAPSGDRFALQVAPLDLPEVGFACYDLAVHNAGGGVGDVVWRRGDPARTRLGQDQGVDPRELDNVANPELADQGTVCSDDFGNGAGGAITYIGPCDADGANGRRTNSVTLWVDGIYAVGGASDLGGWQDPCPSGCTLNVECLENQDSLVEFNLTVMREANQGFFDVAVNFEDIFCSAKADCTEPDGAGLLFDANGERGPTAILAFACTAGENADTQLHMSELGIWCGADSASATLVSTLDPAAGPGNVYVPVSSDPDPDDGVYQYAVYEGGERLGQGDLRKLYWNVAVGLDMESLANTNAETPEADRFCWLRATATASDGGLTDDNATTPFVQWSVPLNLERVGVGDEATSVPSNALICGANPLNGIGPAYCEEAGEDGPVQVPCVSTVYDPVGSTLCFDNLMTGDFETFVATSVDDSPCSGGSDPVTLPNGAPGGCAAYSPDGQTHTVTVRYACDDTCDLYFDGQLVQDPVSTDWSNVFTHTIEGVSTGCHVIGVHTQDSAQIIAGFVATISVDGATEGQPGFFVTRSTPAITVNETAPDDAQGDSWSELDYDVVFPQAQECSGGPLAIWVNGWASLFGAGAAPVWYNTTCDGNYNHGYARIVFTVE